MSERTSFWLAFGLSSIGAILLAALTLDPNESVQNFQGWSRLVADAVTGSQTPAPPENQTPSRGETASTVVAVLSAILAILSAIFSWRRAASRHK